MAKGPLAREFEIETIPGIESFAESELLSVSRDVRFLPNVSREGRRQFAYSGDLAHLDRLRSVVSVHRLIRFDVARPRALLGQQAFQRVVDEARDVIGESPAGTFQTLWISAAGSDSRVYQRFRDELCKHLDLSPGTERGDFHVAVRPGVKGRSWEVLMRLTHRPLSARAWRVCDMPGALNATVAFAMVKLTNPLAGQRFLNLACGSATLMVERLELNGATSVTGCDTSLKAIECGVRNATAAQRAQEMRFILADATELPFRDACFDAIAVDLPFGMLVRARTRDLYTALFREAARVASRSAVLCAVTTDRRALQAALSELAQQWQVRQAIPLRIPFRSGYLHASIYSLSRI